MSKKSNWWGKFNCINCNHSCHRDWMSNWGHCPKCGGDMYREGHEPKETRKLKPMTEMEQKKLGWYKDERKWHDDIRSRRALPNGDVAIVDHSGKVKEVRTGDGRIIK